MKHPKTIKVKGNPGTSDYREAKAFKKGGFTVVGFEDLDNDTSVMKKENNTKENLALFILITMVLCVLGISLKHSNDEYEAEQLRRSEMTKTIGDE